jgi:hypothetical protein
MTQIRTAPIEGDSAIFFAGLTWVIFNPSLVYYIWL